MAAIHDLLKQIGDAKLRERIACEWKTATRNKKFGLVYEQHLPERVPLHNGTPRRGDLLVAKRSGSLAEVWRVHKVEGETAVLIRPRQAGEQWGPMLIFQRRLVSALSVSVARRCSCYG